MKGPPHEPDHEQGRAGSAGTHREEDRHDRDFRTTGLGSQILADLGVRKMTVMSSPLRLHALSGFGLEVVDYIPL